MEFGFNELKSDLYKYIHYLFFHKCACHENVHAQVHLHLHGQKRLIFTKILIRKA